jgi:hypothetical protein
MTMVTVDADSAYWQLAAASFLSQSIVSGTENKSVS